jgi:Tfp pilus assembly protein PilF
MTASFRIRAIVVLLLLGLGAGMDTSRAGPAARPQDALVLVTSNIVEGTRGCYGVAVGDGSVVVTCYSTVYSRSSAGGAHRLAGRIAVVSPYLGDAVDGEILAAEPAVGVVVLRVPWRGHPAWPRAEDESIVAADRLALLGLPGALEILAGTRRDPVEAGEPVAEIDAKVDYVALRQDQPLFVELAGPRDIVLDRWAGAPLVLPGTQRLAAVAVALAAQGRNIEGAVLSRIRSLAPYLQSAASSAWDERVRPPADAQEAFSLYLRIWSALRGRRHEEAAAGCTRFLELRPDCYFGYLGAATAARERDQIQEAERQYREGLSRVPGSVTLRMSYIGFLDRQGRLEEAVQALEPLWQRVALRPYLATGVHSILSKKHEHARCIHWMEEALAVDPNNAYAWLYLGHSHTSLRDHGAAAEAFTKALVLRPENHPTQGLLAHSLEQAGRLDEAERHYRKFVELEPNSEYGHHLFADFLARHRPACRAEALQEARTALRLHDGTATDREKLMRLIQDLESRSE